MKKTLLPTPRLKDVQPGQMVCLSHESRPRILLRADRKFGYFDGLQASLAHEIKTDGMVFGESGWRIK